MRLLSGAFLLVLSALAGAEVRAQAPFAADGWTSWEVRGLAGAGDRCCYRPHPGRTGTRGCRLASDGESSEYFDVIHEAEPADDDALRLFARVEDGGVVELRALSPDCPVTAAVQPRDLGPVDNVESLGWLTRIDVVSRSVDSERIAAIAAHAGEDSRRELIRLAQDTSNPRLRKDAIFWMGQLRVEDTREVLLSLMKDGDTRAIREQAIFSYAQSPANDRLAVLVDLIENPQRDLHDRKKALFWLAQTDDGTGVDYIQDLLSRP